MLVIHANDPTTRVLSRLYESREDFCLRLDEHSSNAAIIGAVKNTDSVMMLGHGNHFGLLSIPDKKGQYRRHLVDSRHVQFLRRKPCIGIWCYANEFAKQYGLQGLFSGMIISELHEAEENNIPATKEEIDTEMEKFVARLKFCIETYGLHDVPARMLELDDIHSPLTEFNYNNLYYYG